MSKPFGFGFPADDDDPGGGSGSGGSGSGGSGSGGSGSGGPADAFGFGAGGDPFAGLLGGLGGGAMNPADLGAAFQRLGQLLSYEGGPVNWDLARDTARAGAAAGNDRFVGQAQHTEVADAVRLAEVWLDAATALPAGATSAVAWSRAEWVEGTLPAWKQLVEPVAAKVVAAMGSALTGGVPEEMRAQAQAMAGPLQQMMSSMGGAMFGAQVGQAIGTLAGEVVGSTDVGLPLGPAGKAVLVPANVAEFGEGLGIAPDQVRLYLALREAAHQRLYAHVPWLRGHVQSALEDYAQGITIDTSHIQEQMSELDPSDPASIQQALGEGLFEPQDTPAQKQALRRLEGLLAVIEGWVDQVVDAAAAERLPSAAALRETVRRRRATGGPAEQTFAALVGLELRPRRLREAADLWAALAQERGIDGRDAVWAHPDLVPTVDDLEDPAGPTGFLTRDATPLDLSGLDELGAAPDQGSDRRPEEGTDPRTDEGPDRS